VTSNRQLHTQMTGDEETVEKVPAGSGEVPRFEIKSKFCDDICVGSRSRDCVYLPLPISNV